MAYGTQGGLASGQLAVPTQARDCTTLEQHLNALRNIREMLGAAAHRTNVLAERMFGAEPAAPGNAIPSTSKEAGLLTCIENEAREIHAIGEHLHLQLNRLERL